MLKNSGLLQFCRFKAIPYFKLGMPPVFYGINQGKQGRLVGMTAQLPMVDKKALL